MEVSVEMKIMHDQRILNDTLNSEYNEEVIKSIVNEYSECIDSLKLMKSEEIKKMVERTFQNKEAEVLKRIISNLEFIKISTLVEEEHSKEVTVEIPRDALGSISLDDLIDPEEFKGKGSIEISVDLIKKILDEKKESDCWSEDNVAETLEGKFGVSQNKIKMINNLSDYIDFVANLDIPVNFVSRGQKDCSFDLVPSLYRIYKEDHNIHAKRYESNFRQKILYYEKTIRDRSNEELRAEGQHFGLPTNYLDFTEAHLISLLFAIEDYNYKENHAIVFFVDACAYNNAAVNRNEKLINYDSPEQIRSLEEFDSRSFFIKLGNLNERIHFQKGCFLKISINELYRDSFKQRLAENCEIAVINKNVKKEILIELFHLGVTFENIYPDKDNLVKSIKFNYEEILRGRI